MFPTGEANIVPWTRTAIDGTRRVPPSAVRPGALWERLPDCAPTLDVEAGPGLRSCGLVRPPVRLGTITLADGSRAWTGAVWQPADTGLPILVFEGDAPPVGLRIEVIDATLDDSAAPPVICFTAGTPVETARGARAVEDVRPGDRLWTQDCGYRDVLWVGRRRIIGATLAARPELRPVRLQDSDVLVSPDHRVVRRTDARGGGEELVPAHHVQGARRVLPAGGLSYVHLMLEDHQILRTGDLFSESFHPGAMPLSSLSPADRHALYAVVPALRIDPNAFGDTARPVAA